MMNSGSFFPFIVAIIMFQLGKLLFHAIAIFFSKFGVCRKIGMKLYDTHKMQSFKYGFLKLLMESYFDIMLCIILGLLAFKYDVGAQETIKSFFNTNTDRMNSVITLLLFVMCLVFPIWGHFGLVKNFKKLKEDKV
jgi:hypothetical protein